MAGQDLSAGSLHWSVLVWVLWLLPTVQNMTVRLNCHRFFLRRCPSTEHSSSLSLISKYLPESCSTCCLFWSKACGYVFSENIKVTVLYPCTSTTRCHCGSIYKVTTRSIMHVAVILHSCQMKYENPCTIMLFLIYIL